jgi:transposase
MLTVPRGVRVFIAVAPLDMRGGLDTMAGRVRRLGLEPVDGGLFVFLSRSRTMAAVFWFDGSGWCCLRKRLVKGTFELPAVAQGVERMAVDGRVLNSLLDGIDLRAPRRRWYDRDRLAAGGASTISSGRSIDAGAPP